jgi:hypothetical protein
VNLCVLKKSRRPPQPGDIFAMQLPDGSFLYGRVIDIDANPLGVGNGVLVYVYRAGAAAKQEVPELRLDDLLLPPIITNRLGWTHGFFEVVRTDQLRSEDQLPQHCFRNSSGRYFDARGAPLDGPVEPVGPWALHSYKTIDVLVSRALGLDESKAG